MAERRKPWDHGGKTRHQRGYGTDWERIRKQVLERDKYLCQPCFKEHGRLTSAHAVDHILAKANGGTDALGNLRSICRACHLDKTLRDQGKRRRRRIALDGWPSDE